VAFPAHQGSDPMVNQEESNGKLPPCVHCQESDNGSLSSPKVVLDLMVLSTFHNNLLVEVPELMAFKLSRVGGGRGGLAEQICKVLYLQLLGKNSNLHEKKLRADIFTPSHSF